MRLRIKAIFDHHNDLSLWEVRISTTTDVDGEETAPFWKLDDALLVEEINPYFKQFTIFGAKPRKMRMRYPK